MISQNINIPLAISECNREYLQKGLWLTILHAQRIPPHIGMMFSGNYNSLTIKGHELNIPADTIFKAIAQKKIKSIFVKIAPHPVFSIEHQLEMFHTHLLGFESVKQFEATCLSPIRLFFREFYAIDSPENELFYEFVQRLSHNRFLTEGMTMNLDPAHGIELPCYTLSELNEKIINERKPYFND